MKRSTEDYLIYDRFRRVQISKLFTDWLEHKIQKYCNRWARASAGFITKMRISYYRFEIFFFRNSFKLLAGHRHVGSGRKPLYSDRKFRTYYGFATLGLVLLDIGYRI